MAIENLFEVQSTDDFKERLSVDLKRISLINFWASWAQPCQQMNKVVEELAKKYPTILFLNVEAEGQPDIAESFDVDSVPLFLILQGHTLLERISGADASKLTAAVAKHATSAIPKPLSVTTQAPAAAPNVINLPEDSEKKESQEELDKRMRGLMNQSKIVLFMKGSPTAPRCGFSRKISTLLKENNVEFSHFDILTDESVRQGLKRFNEWPTFPQLIVDGELVGGLDIVREMIASGEFKELVA